MIHFLRKEIMELLRTGKFFIIIIVYTLFGIMNPMIAKLTPWLMETMADTMEESGFVISEVTVDALTSWQQFFKNLPIALIVFVFVMASVYTHEYQKGTLIIVVTKGVSRYKIAVAKYVAMIGLWTIGYVFMFGITYGYNAYFWDNSIAKELIGAVVLYWLFGCMIISFIQLFSTLVSGTSGVMLGTLGVVVVSYLVTMIGTIKEFSPVQLTGGFEIVTGMLSISECMKAMVVTVVVTIICFAASIPLFERKGI